MASVNYRRFANGNPNGEEITKGENSDAVIGHQLKPGDWLTGLEEQTSLVESVTITRTQKAVYNIRVVEDHTYFVGCHEWGFEVWVHNDYSVQKAADGTFQIIDDSGNVVRSGFKLPDEADGQRKGVRTLFYPLGL